MGFLRRVMFPIKVTPPSAVPGQELPPIPVVDPALPVPPDSVIPVASPRDPNFGRPLPYAVPALPGVSFLGRPVPDLPMNHLSDFLPGAHHKEYLAHLRGPIANRARAVSAHVLPEPFRHDYNQMMAQALKAIYVQQLVLLHPERADLPEQARRLREAVQAGALDLFRRLPPGERNPYVVAALRAFARGDLYQAHKMEQGQEGYTRRQQRKERHQRRDARIAEAFSGLPEMQMLFDLVCGASRLLHAAEERARDRAVYIRHIWFPPEVLGRAPDRGVREPIREIALLPAGGENLALLGGHPFPSLGTDAHPLLDGPWSRRDGPGGRAQAGEGLEGQGDTVRLGAAAPGGALSPRVPGMPVHAEADLAPMLDEYDRDLGPRARRLALAREALEDASAFARDCPGPVSDASLRLASMLEAHVLERPDEDVPATFSLAAAGDVGLLQETRGGVELALEREDPAQALRILGAPDSVLEAVLEDARLEALADRDLLAPEVPGHLLLSGPVHDAPGDTAPRADAGGIPDADGLSLGRREDVPLRPPPSGHDDAAMRVDQSSTLLRAQGATLARVTAPDPDPDPGGPRAPTATLAHDSGARERDSHVPDGRGR